MAPKCTPPPTAMPSCSLSHQRAEDRTGDTVITDIKVIRKEVTWPIMRFIKLDPYFPVL